MIFSVVNLKGGAGKTTVATNLVYALSRKNRTLLVDTDLQRSASAWYANRENDNDNFSVVSIVEDKSLKKQVPVFRTQYDHVVIDGAPQLDVINAIAIMLADVVVIPVTPSPYDVWATAAITDRIKAAQEIQEGKKAYFLLNRANDQTAISRETKEVLDSFGFPVFRSALHNRVIYADSASSGRSVLESSNPKAKDEFESFVSEINEIIRKGK